MRKSSASLRNGRAAVGNFGQGKLCLNVCRQQQREARNGFFINSFPKRPGGILAFREPTKLFLSSGDKVTERQISALAVTRNFLACFCVQLPKSFPHVNARPDAGCRRDYVQPDGHELALVSLAENRPRRRRAANQIGDKQEQWPTNLLAPLRGNTAGPRIKLGSGVKRMRKAKSLSELISSELKRSVTP